VIRAANVLAHFARDDQGATMLEYAVMAALIASASIAILIVVGSKTQMMFASANTF
jgi:Flp pilus assembly pilin Flp